MWESMTGGSFSGASASTVVVSMELGSTGWPSTPVGTCEMQNSSRWVGVRESRRGRRISQWVRLKILLGGLMACAGWGFCSILYIAKNSQLFGRERGEGQRGGRVELQLDNLTQEGRKVGLVEGPCQVVEGTEN